MQCGRQNLVVAWITFYRAVARGACGPLVIINSDQTGGGEGFLRASRYSSGSRQTGVPHTDVGGLSERRGGVDFRCTDVLRLLGRAQTPPH